MNNLPLQPLVWFETEYSVGVIPNIGAQGAGIFYRIAKVGDKTAVTWHDQSEGSTGAKELGSVCEAKNWIATDHYPSKMQPYVKQDSITDIRNWFKAAKPEPTSKDKTTQLGCVVEEFAELMESVGLDGTARELQGIADELKGFTQKYAAKFIERINKIDALDATSDITVTVQGFNQLMGFDGLGAQREVIRSNNSKMVNGKFEFDDNGKIMKAEGYSQPDLKPFLE